MSDFEDHLPRVKCDVQFATFDPVDGSLGSTLCGVEHYTIHDRPGCPRHRQSTWDSARCDHR